MASPAAWREALKLLLDEMYSGVLARQLRERGFDVTAVVDDLLLRNRPDDVIMALAWTENRTVVTADVADYRLLAARILSDGQRHAGLILVTNTAFPQQNRRTHGRLLTALVALLSIGPDLSNSEHWLQ